MHRHKTYGCLDTVPNHVFAQCTSKVNYIRWIFRALCLAKTGMQLLSDAKCAMQQVTTHTRPAPMVHQHAPHHSPAHANHRDEPLPPRWSDATAGLQSAPPGDPSRCQTAWVDCAASLSGHAAQPTGTRRLLPMLSHRNPVDKE